MIVETKACLTSIGGSGPEVAKKRLARQLDVDCWERAGGWNFTTSLGFLEVASATVPTNPTRQQIGIDIYSEEEKRDACAHITQLALPGHPPKSLFYSRGGLERSTWPFLVLLAFLYHDIYPFTPKGNSFNREWNLGQKRRRCYILYQQPVNWHKTKQQPLSELWIGGERLAEEVASFMSSVKSEIPFHNQGVVNVYFIFF